MRASKTSPADFWGRLPGLAWSNPKAGDAAHIRAALLRPRFGRLLEIALEFGVSRMRVEWRVLAKENTPEARRAKAPVERILGNIEKGFSRVAARN
jgi:hypothetical protein